MTNQEYINEHPEKFVDDIDKWLYTEFYIVGGCCSAQGSMEYSVARMVAEKMKQQMINKAIEWLENNLSQEVSIISGGYVHINFENSIKEFRKALEE